MTVANRKPAGAASSNKRKKISSDGQNQNANERPKKKSPLFDKPQNYYAPPSIATMTREELSEWRKQQRRVRNRESAATSRNKTRAKIKELEGEVGRWKSKYAEMEEKMRRLERHIQFLTEIRATPLACGSTVTVTATATPSSSSVVVSHPNTPPSSPPPRAAPMAAVPNAVTSMTMPPPPPYLYHSVLSNTANPFPPLLSEPRDCAQVEKKEAAATAVAPTSSNQEPSRHLTPISRQAVKITGANLDSSADLRRNKQQQRLPDLLVRTSQGKKRSEGDEAIESTSNQPIYDGALAESVERLSEESNEGVSKSDVIKCNDMPMFADCSSATDGDDFLDLLVETLDGEFDPDLLM